MSKTVFLLVSGTMFINAAGQTMITAVARLHHDKMCFFFIILNQANFNYDHQILTMTTKTMETMRNLEVIHKEVGGCLIS